MVPEFIEVVSWLGERGDEVADEVATYMINNDIQWLADNNA